MGRLALVIIVIFFTFLSVTYMLHKFFYKKPYVKYLPAVLSLILAFIYLYLARMAKGDGFRDLARGLLAFLLFTGFLSGILSALYYDYIHPKLTGRNKS